MRKEATCDRCYRTILPTLGYLFYSRAHAPVSTPLLYCESCTTNTLSHQTNAANANDPAIRSSCSHLHLTAEEAKAWARELATIWWQDQVSGVLQAEDFWTSDPWIPPIIAWAETEEEAQAIAEATIPAGARVVSRVLHHHPQDKTVMVRARDANSAQEAIVRSSIAPESIIVEDASLKQTHRLHSLLFGGAPREYQVKYRQLAVIKLHLQRPLQLLGALSGDELWARAIGAVNSGAIPEAKRCFALAIRMNPHKYCGIGPGSWRPATADQHATWLAAMRDVGYAIVAQSLLTASISSPFTVAEMMSNERHLQEVLNGAVAKARDDAS